MVDRENTVATQAEKRISRGRRKDRHIVSFVLPVVLTILFPGGGIYYLCGRFSPNVLSFANICMVYPVVVIFIFWCLFTGIVKLSKRRGKHTRKERFLIIAETCVPLIFVGLFLAPFFVGRERIGMGLVGIGLRHRVESEVDIAATRAWLTLLDDEDYDSYGGVFSSDLPESFRGLKNAGAILSADENGNAKIRLEWGGTPTGHWGIVIGMKDMKIPPSESSPEAWVIMPVEPGVYVWWGE